MRPIENIRRNIFRVTQQAFAEIAGTTQPQVSRWEDGRAEPSRDEMAKIRLGARRRRLPWDDRFFFEVPKAAPAERVSA
jgi:transcriptional regulator with XRE-family HTH domain